MCAFLSWVFALYRPRQCLKLGVIVLGVSVLVTSHAAFADAGALTSAGANGTHFSSPFDTEQDAVGAGQTALASSSATGSGAVFSAGAPFPPVGTQSGQGVASALATEGTLRASVSASSATAGIVQNASTASSTANARWNDTLVVDAGGTLFDQPGIVTADFLVSGMFVTGLGGPGGNDALLQASEVRLGVRIAGTGMTMDPLCGWAYCVIQRANSGNIFGGPLVDISTIPEVIHLNIPVIFGREVTLAYILDLYALTSTFTAGNGSGTAAISSADYSHTLRWGGITGVFDESGASIDNYSLTSASNFNYLYAAAVPTPLAFWLMVSGLPLAMLRRKAWQGDSN